MNGPFTLNPHSPTVQNADGKTVCHGWGFDERATRDNAAMICSALNAQWSADIASPLAGVPLRDFFAAAALQGMFARPSSSPSGHPKTSAGYAAAAYESADAMLKTRGGA